MPDDPSEDLDVTSTSLDRADLEEAAEELGLEDIEDLDDQALKPTSVSLLGVEVELGGVRVPWREAPVPAQPSRLVPPPIAGTASTGSPFVTDPVRTRP